MKNMFTAVFHAPGVKLNEVLVKNHSGHTSSPLFKNKDYVYTSAISLYFLVAYNGKNGRRFGLMELSVSTFLSCIKNAFDSVNYQVIFLRKILKVYICIGVGGSGAKRVALYRC